MGADPMIIDDPALARAVEAFAARDGVLVALDFDGTLAPLVDDPEAAAALPENAAALRALAAAPGTHLAVVSGRSVGTLQRLLGPVGPLTLIGSHGAEIARPGAGPGDAVRPAGPPVDGELLARLLEAVQGIVGAHAGAALEEKPAAVVLHTRRADRAAALAATADALLGPARWSGVHVLVGKEVVEFAVTDVSKGGALRRLRADLGLEPGGVLYAGDDTTDERAFAVLDDDAGDVTIKVGEGRTRARHRVADPAGLAVLLTDLARRRRG